jgi:hypothetical protein
MIKRSSLYLLLVLIFFSCIKCAEDKSGADSNVKLTKVNFLINGVDAPKTRTMVSTTDLLGNPTEWMFYAVVGEKITLEPEIVPNVDLKAEWTLDGDPWNLSQSKEGKKTVYTYAFKENEVGTHYEIELNVADKSMYKHIKVVESAAEIPGSAKYKSNGVLAQVTPPVETPPNEDNQENIDNGSTENNNSINTDTEPTQSVTKPVTKPTPPPAQTKKPVNKPITKPPATKPKVEKPKVQKISFSAPTEVLVGKKISVQDKSTPADAVVSRIWDFGDGSPQQTSFGKFMSHKYLLPDTYTIKLYVNGDRSKYESKTVRVKPLPPPPKAKQPAKTPDKPKPTPPAKPTVSSVSIVVPSSAYTGNQVTFEDKSQPAGSVESRTWTINGSSLKTPLGRPSYTFDKPGPYKIKLCVNGSSSLCDTKTIVVSNKPAPPPKTPSNEPEFVGEDILVGLKSGLKCIGENIVQFSGRTHLLLTPKRHIELESAYVYSSANGRIRLTLADQDNNILESIISAVNPGESYIPLSDLGATLSPGTTYKLLFETLDQGLSLEDSMGCNLQFRSRNDKVGIKYNNQIVLYDLRVVY